MTQNGGSADGLKEKQEADEGHSETRQEQRSWLL